MGKGKREKNICRKFADKKNKQKQGSSGVRGEKIKREEREGGCLITRNGLRGGKKGWFILTKEKKKGKRTLPINIGF